MRLSGLQEWSREHHGQYGQEQHIEQGKERWWQQWQGGEESWRQPEQCQQCQCFSRWSRQAGPVAYGGEQKTRDDRGCIAEYHFVRVPERQLKVVIVPDAAGKTTK